MNNRIQLLKRDFSYTFWTFAEQVAYLALPRLLLFPLAAYIIGKEDFGIFSYAMSITLILGMQPQNGLSTGLLRHLPEYSEDQRTLFLGTARYMCSWVMISIVSIGVIGSLIAGFFSLTSWKLIHCLIPLIILLHPENQFLLILTEMRFLRQFRPKALWIILRATAAVLGGVVGAWLGGVIGLSWGFMLGNTSVYILLRMHPHIRRQAGYNPEMAALLKSIWLQITIAGILTVSIPHVNRIMLGSYHAYTVVADFVAATSVMFLYMAPTFCFGGLILSMLSQYSSIRQLSRRGIIYCLAILMFGVTVLPVLMLFTGPFIIKILYPQFGEDSIHLLRIVTWIIPSETLACLTRPFIYKFSPVKTIPIVNAVSFLIILALAVLLIPPYAAEGAAWAYVIGNALTALIWSLVCIRTFLFVPKSKEAVIQTSATATIP